MRRAVATLILIFAVTPAAPAEERKDREGFPLPDEAVARVGSARLRHGRWLQRLSYSPDGKKLVSAGSGVLRVWDPTTGKLLRHVALDAEWIVDSCFSADGKAVVAHDGKAVRWFDADSGKEVRACKIAVKLMSNSYAALAPGGAALAVNDEGKSLVVYELPSGKLRWGEKSERSWFWPPVFSPDGKALAAFEWNGRPAEKNKVKLFETATGKALREIDSPAGFLSHLTFSPDGKKLLGEVQGGDLFVWDTTSGKELHRIKPPPPGVAALAFTPDGGSVVIGNQWADVLLLDLKTEEVAARFRTHPTSIALTFTPDGKALAVGTGSGQISQWDLATGKALAASAEPIAGPWRLAFAADGKELRTTGGAFRTFDWATGRETHRLDVGYGKRAWLLTASPDWSRFAGAESDEKFVVWDKSGKVVTTLQTAAKQVVTAVVFAPDGRRLYTAENNGPVRAWDAATGKELSALDKEARSVRALAVSPDGRWLASADHPQVRAPRPEVAVWDLEKGREAYRLATRPETARTWDLAFSADGTQLATVGAARQPGAGFVIVWDLRTGRERASRTGLKDEPLGVAFSHDGRTVATGAASGAVRLWEAATAGERHAFAGHTSDVYSVAFSPDDRLVAAASADAPVFIWDVTGARTEPPSATAFGRDDEERLWKSLADSDAAAAFGAMRRLMGRPGPAAALLAGRLKPVPSADEKAVRRLLRDIDSDDFDTRRKAAAELAKVADQGEPLLRAALKESPSAEVKRQVEDLLAGLDAPTAARLRALRAVEALERIGTKEARRLLEELAGGAKEARLTRDARAALERLKKSS